MISKRNAANRRGSWAAATSSRQRPICSVSLVKNEAFGKHADGERASRPFALSFTAFGREAKAVSRNVTVGDRLLVEYIVEYSDPRLPGRKDYCFRFMVGASMTRSRALSKRAGGLSP